VDLYKILTCLHEELDRLNAAILTLERLQQEGPSRGRPPKVLSEITKASRTGSESDAAPDEPLTGED
jgi:hypothetical protein